MATRYEKSLGKVPCLTGCTGRELRVLARLVDDVSVPAGGHVHVARGDVILVASGDAVALPDNNMFAATALRLLVIGRREVLSLLHAAPDLGSRLLAASAASRGAADEACHPSGHIADETSSQFGVARQVRDCRSLGGSSLTSLWRRCGADGG